MNSIELKWLAWHGDKTLNLSFPSIFNIHLVSMNDSPSLKTSEIKRAISYPICKESLHALAKERKEAIILVDDLSRPTPTFKILPFVLEELERGGITEDHIRIMVALGAHRHIDHEMLVKKLGEETLERIDVYQHNIFNHLVYLGETTANTPVFINREVMECDLKIGIDATLPSGEGFTGGAKIILPGVSGLKTIHHDHTLANFSSYAEHLRNREEAAEMVGLDFCIDVVFNSKRKIAGVFSGNFKVAHKEAEEFGKKVYATNVLQEVDVAVVNGYPQDNEISIRLLPNYIIRTVKKGGVIVLIAPCPEGRPIHFYYSKWGTKYASLGYERALRLPEEKKLVIYSPKCKAKEFYKAFSYENTFVYKSWDEVLGKLEDFYSEKEKVNVSVFPCAPIQRPSYLN